MEVPSIIYVCSAGVLCLCWRTFPSLCESSGPVYQSHLRISGDLCQKCLHAVLSFAAFSYRADVCLSQESSSVQFTPSIVQITAGDKEITLHYHFNRETTTTEELTVTIKPAFSSTDVRMASEIFFNVVIFSVVR